MRVAVIGTGIAGNVAAWQLSREHEITVFESLDRVGGHTHTHRVTLQDHTCNIDTGFIVFNDWTYPRFGALLRQLGVESQPTRMSFSVRDEASGLEYNGTSLNTLFAQRRNLLRPSFLRMIREILRFNREASGLLTSTDGELPLGSYLEECGYSRAFIDHYIVPMGAAIWSTDPLRMRAFPAHFFVRFLHNHGMLSIDDRPVWRVVCGGSARYVERLTESFRDRIRLSSPVERIRRVPGGVIVKSRATLPERFDAVFLACHADEALALLSDASPREREILGSLPYQENEAVLHTDRRLLPRSRRAWAAWNYHVLPGRNERVALTYNMNILQGLSTSDTVLVTLNRTTEIRPERVIARMRYSHPLFTPASLAAQRRHRELNGAGSTYFCGAYWRFGFHEDGVVSAETALQHFRDDVSSGRFSARGHTPLSWAS